jgi:hypothetical protein
MAIYENWLACHQRYSVSWSLLPAVGEGRRKRDEMGEEIEMKRGGENDQLGEENTMKFFFFFFFFKKKTKVIF